MSVKLALLCREGKSLTRLAHKEFEIVEGDLAQKGNHEYETGWWVMEFKRASSLVGKPLILTERKDDPAYLGGIITGLRIETASGRTGRICFTFVEDSRLKGNTEHIGNWESRNPVRYLEGEQCQSKN